ncbi:hypothetical protein ZTR_10573 [Talaromyces verruculosus]|nr:hypothetical protein ZTR_10573 [Talaromyces verruculosus]
MVDYKDNGSMSESQTGVATLEDVDVKTFGLFIEYAYKGDYATPMLATVNRSTGTDMTSSGPISKRNRNDSPGLWKVEEAYRNFTNATGVEPTGDLSTKSLLRDLVIH